MTEPEKDAGKASGPRISPAQWKLFAAVLVIGVAGFVYTYFRRQGLSETAALYLGLPLILALGLSLTPQGRSATDASIKGTIIALLLAAPVFQEGYICILFASPLFIGIAAIVGLLVDAAKRRRDNKSTLKCAFAATVIALMALEGTTPGMSLPREHEVAVSKVVPASIEAVRAALATPPIVGENKPLFLRIFPYPVAIAGDGLAVGDTRSATFVAYKHIFWNRIEGTAVFKIVEAAESKIAFELASDTSYVSHYLDWRRSEVELEPAPGGTRVTWRLSFHRKYDPYWYFGTLQKYAVGLVAEELIDHVATPRT